MTLTGKGQFCVCFLINSNEPISVPVAIRRVLVMKIKETPAKLRLAANLNIIPLDFNFVSSRGKYLAKISPNFIRSTQIYLSSTSGNLFEHDLEMIALVALATKINSVAYKFDHLPIPEITYGYQNERVRKSLF